MTNEELKYRKILEMLKKSQPVPEDTSLIEEAVMERIRRSREIKKERITIFDYLFSWVYIGWIRAGFLTAAAVLIAMFVLQQSIIIKRINSLEKQANISYGASYTRLPADAREKLLRFRLAGKRLTGNSINISREDLEKLIESYTDLKNKYSDLIKLIDDDPALRQYLEKKISEIDKKKFNL